jgi:hypothetical protein
MEARTNVEADWQLGVPGHDLSRASSFVIRFAVAEGSTPVGRLAARLRGSEFGIDIRYGKGVGVADDI